jgi:hypothetical protein
MSAGRHRSGTRSGHVAFLDPSSALKHRPLRQRKSPQ